MRVLLQIRANGAARKLAVARRKPSETGSRGPARSRHRTKAVRKRPRAPSPSAVLPRCAHGLHFSHAPNPAPLCPGVSGRRDVGRPGGTTGRQPRRCVSSQRAVPCQQQQPALQDDRPVPRRPHEGRSRGSRPAKRVLRGRRQRRRLEDDGLRPRVVPHLRRPAHRVGWRNRGGAVQSRHRLRRQRRGAPAPRPLHGQRYLQIDRRGQDVAASRPPRRATNPADCGRPEEPEPPLGGSARPSLRPERRARDLPLHRRRCHLPEGSLQGREHRGRGRRPRPGQPGRGVRRPVGIS